MKKKKEDADKLLEAAAGGEENQAPEETGPTDILADAAQEDEDIIF